MTGRGRGRNHAGAGRGGGVVAARENGEAGTAPVDDAKAELDDTWGTGNTVKLLKRRYGKAVPRGVMHPAQCPNCGAHLDKGDRQMHHEMHCTIRDQGEDIYELQEIAREHADDMDALRARIELLEKWVQVPEEGRERVPWGPGSAPEEDE